jgi:short subunit dehydrogenase-like uncharacterized protein
MTPPRYDLIVFGATSFVGRILCRYLADRVGQDLTWAVAGRSPARLDALKSSLGPAAAALPILQADATDEAALRALCDQARVVVSTVGPYALHGEPLVRACAESGTDYLDLAGEVQWIARMIERYQDTARRSGARLVPCSGFDSIPSDLGVLHLQQLARERFGVPCPRVKMRVRRMRGGASGGTVASLLNAIREAASDPAVRKLMGNPYALCPASDRPTFRQPDVKRAQWDADANSWVAPFVMAAINTRVVQRSQSLLQHAYGEGFAYDEAMSTGRGFRGALRAGLVTLGLGGLMLGASFAPTRALLARFLPGPGEGPSPAEQEAGLWDMHFIGHTADGQVLRTRVHGDRDPGYGSTAKMLGEAALCLALDTPRNAHPGGFWTPASLFGMRLVERLQAHAGVRFESL